ncbi:MgtC/SapB family protein [Tepidibacter formicigenes]|jgi:putative Mg2+ transporter-C (MgtC) family protein|uniref:Putative Mg2+ transporter-C (MgtC) family protein n=1 Tax=Tepidibacter formicigenes DSM 15518 TaxID=1123349 RepID=A0A1M6LBN8_9FIRM|nr:MgtC/SapB family protein [Tepidibacter formicigenes]SHJ68606.1 putative Mg2+ transporter-C (MgtC) family protein [Tepidibacter formicigenes DSM 15518]
MTHKEMIFRLLFTLFIGGMVGIEREKSHQWAGFRTHILVAVGSCVVSVTSLMLFRDHINYVNLDPARMPAQVLSGIGFLGAGAILKTSNSIRGITTAAGIWVTACIGLAVGFGYYYLGFMTWFILMTTLYTLKVIENKFVLSKTSTFYITTLNISETTSRVVSIIERNRIVIKNIDISQGEDKFWNMKLTVLYNSKIPFKGIVEKILELDNVVKIDYEE